MTTLSYLSHPQCLQMEVSVTSTSVDPTTGAVAIFTDDTPVYVQGGGQPSDMATLSFYEHTMPVQRLALRDAGVAHEVISSSEPAVGDVVTISVDPEKRHYHNRLHTSGELICLACQQARPAWSVTSAIHFPGNSSVTFDSNGTSDISDAFLAEVEARLNELIQSDFRVNILPAVDVDEAERLVQYSLRHLNHKAVRLVNPAPDFYRACMGTHVDRTGRIGAVTIRKMKLRKGKVVVSYELAP